MNRYFFLLFSFLFCMNLSAQFTTAVIDEMELQFKVKQIDEFMQRFNYDITFNGTRPVAKADSVEHREDRLRNMLTLFDLETYTDEEKKVSNDVLELIGYVMDNNIRLNYEDSTWYAKLACEGTIAGEKTMVDLSLRVERITGVEYKWVIFDVNGKIFDSLNTEDALFISPAEHGIGFITLADIINSNPLAIETIEYKEHKNDKLSVFNYLIANNALKIKGVEKVTYHYHIGRYDFDVERIERENTYNTGWLVNNIIINNN